MKRKTIGDVLRELTPNQKDRLAKVRGVTPNGLANSYGGDWVELMKEMTNAELARALSKVLDDNELRVAALRAFDGRAVPLTTQQQTPRGVIERLCHTAPKALQQRTWTSVYAKMLRDLGWESDKIPAGLEDSIRLQKIFE